jgi:hypothetical protein
MKSVDAVSGGYGKEVGAFAFVLAFCVVVAEAFVQRLSRSIVLRGVKPVHQRKTVCPRRRHGKPQNAPEIIRFGFVSASGD